MDDTKYYDVINDAVLEFDKVVYALEKMKNEGENARIRTLAQVTINHISMVRNLTNHLVSQEK